MFFSLKLEASLIWLLGFHILQVILLFYWPLFTSLFYWFSYLSWCANVESPRDLFRLKEVGPRLKYYLPLNLKFLSPPLFFFTLESRRVFSTARLASLLHWNDKYLKFKDLQTTSVFFLPLKLFLPCFFILVNNTGWIVHCSSN